MCLYDRGNSMWKPIVEEEFLSDADRSLRIDTYSVVAVNKRYLM